MHGIIEDECKWAQDTCNNTCQVLNSLIDIARHSLEEIVKD